MGEPLSYNSLVSGPAAPSRHPASIAGTATSQPGQHAPPVTESTMDRPVDPPATFTDRHYEAIVDSKDLRSAIVESLAVTPIAEESLRRAVWTYVASERNAGTSPGHVIV